MTSEKPTLELSQGVNISLFNEVDDNKNLVEKITTDANGEAVFYGHINIWYYFLAEKNGAKNIIDRYVVNGISSTGELKFKDINADGYVDENDRTDYGGSITNKELNITKEKTIYIAK